MRKLSYPRNIAVWVLAFLCTVVLAGGGQPRCDIPADPGDEAALRGLANEFFAAYANRNLDRFIGLWARQSPDLPKRREQAEQFFAATEQIQISNLLVRKLKIEGQQATIWFSLEMSGVDAKTHQPAAGLGKRIRSLHCVRTAGAWTVWHECPAEEDFADDLMAALDSGRSRLFGENADLVTPALTQALFGKTLRLVDDEKQREALPVILLARGVAERLGDKRALGQALRIAGNIYNVEGDYVLALASYKKALELGAEMGDKAGIARTLNNLGYTYYLQGKCDLAIENYNRSLELKEAAGDKAGVASTSNNLGIVYDQLGNRIQALAYYEKGLALRTAMGDQKEIALILNNIGVLHHDQRNYALALSYYEKSLSIGSALGDKTQTARALNNLGTLKREQGDLAAALQYLQRSLALKQSLGNRPGMAATFINIGNVYRQQGNYDLAMEQYNRSRELVEGLGDRWEMALTMLNMAELEQERRSYSKAVDLAERSAMLATEAGYRECISDAKATAGRAYRMIGQFRQARQALDDAIETLEALRRDVAGGERDREAYFENQVSPYQEMVALMVAQNDPAGALSYAERSKGRVLLDVLRSGRVNVTKAMTPDELEREQQLQTRLVSIGKQISWERLRPAPDSARLADLTAALRKTRLEHEDFETGLYAAHPELKAQRGEAPPIDPGQLSGLIQNRKIAFLEYVVTDEKTYLFVITNRDAGAVDVSSKPRAAPEREAASQDHTLVIRAYELPIGGKDLAGAAERFRSRLANRDKDYREIASELYNLLIRPAQSQLQGQDTLVIVPDAALWNVPFQALESSAGHFLIEDYALSYSPSLTVLAEMMKTRMRPAVDKRSNALRLLAVGNPAVAQETAGRVKSVLASASLEPLPEAESQVRSLASLYGPEHSLVYVGAGATEVAVKTEAPNCDILHLATHGVLDDASPMYSYLVLSQTGEKTSEDGLLEAWEIMNLKLSADLVVLSACDTARGRIGAGEGVVGLSWAFFVAGCPTTVVSQWKVDAASTSDLMVEFHRNLRGPPGSIPATAGKAEALRQASLKLMRGKRYQHPFYWAAFSVIGNPF